MVRTIILRKSNQKNQDYLMLNKSVFIDVFLIKEGTIHGSAAVLC